MSVVDGATHTQKDDVESNGCSLENVAKVFVLLFCGVQLVLRSGVLTVLDLDKVDVTPRFAEVFRSMLSGVGGSTGGWRCCWDAPSLPQLPPATPKNLRSGVGRAIWELFYFQLFQESGDFAWSSGHVYCMGMIMGLSLVFYVFFCKPVDVVEGISFRACCFDGGVCKVGVGGG